jgi:hypothetical protein
LDSEVIMYKNHLKLGNRKIIHKGKVVATSLNSKEFREFIDSIRSIPSKVGTIPPGYEHRADRIANLFYGSPEFDWLVCWSNNISDPFQQLNIGDRLKIINFR